MHLTAVKATDSLQSIPRSEKGGSCPWITGKEEVMMPEIPPRLILANTSFIAEVHFSM